MPNRCESIVIVIGIVIAGILFTAEFTSHLYIAGSLLAFTTSYGLGLRGGSLVKGWFYGSVSSFAYLLAASSIFHSASGVKAAGMGAPVLVAAHLACSRTSGRNSPHR